MSANDNPNSNHSQPQIKHSKIPPIAKLDLCTQEWQDSGDKSALCGQLGLCGMLRTLMGLGYIKKTLKTPFSFNYQSYWLRLH